MLRNIKASEKARITMGKVVQRKYAEGKMPLSDEDAH
jgi:hypothetical protein